MAGNVQPAQRTRSDAATGPAGRRAQRRGLLPLSVAIVALFGFATLALLVGLGDTDAFDLGATRAWQRLDSPLLLRLMVAVSWFGFEPQATILGVAAIGFLFARRLHLEGAFALLAVAVSSLSGVVKALAQRPRPAADLDGVIVQSLVGGYSFPSGHVLSYTVFGGYLAYLVYTLVRPRPLCVALLVPLLGLVALVGPSRVYLGHHWLTDALASYLLGTALLVLLLALYRFAKGRQLAGAGARPTGSG
jgi:membrane-associated phospholipid phosphatase